MTCTNLRIHFVHRHVLYMVVIMEEGNRLHHCCQSCNMFLPWAALNRHHPATDLCAWGGDRKRQHLEVKEDRAGGSDDIPGL